MQLVRRRAHNFDHLNPRARPEELTQKFGGATSFQRASGQGLWLSGGETEEDSIAVVEVMVEHLDRTFWRSLRERLERELAQEEIAIRAQEITRL
jgi:hypothetical protein